MRLHLQSYDGSLVLWSDSRRRMVVRLVSADRVPLGGPDKSDCLEVCMPAGMGRDQAEYFATELDLALRATWPPLDS